MRSSRVRTAALLPVLVLSLMLPPAVTAREASPSPAVSPGPSPSDRASPLPTPTSPYPLETTSWRLTEYRWLDQERGVGPEVTTRVSFVDGRVQGTGGCNRLTGTYRQAGSVLTTAVDTQTQRSCAEQTMLVERALLHGLETAAAYRIIGASEAWQAELHISDDFGNTQLRFRIDDAGTLTVGDWWLESYTIGGATTLADTDRRSVLTFSADRQPAVIGSVNGDVVGSTGCNGIVAEFYQYGSVLSFGPLDRTDAPCGPAIADQEGAMVAVLDATGLFLELPPGRLTLTSADSGDRLDLVSSSPLEDSTWLLERLPGRESPRREVTLRLVDGIASGEGPCGSYGGDYETNGVLIRFSGLAGVDGSCADARAARRYLSALRRTRFADLTRPSLRFLDRSGEMVVRFRDPGGP